MTIEEYLTGVAKIYYQMSVIVKGKQLLTLGKTHRLTDIRDDKGMLGTIRFSTLSLPAATEVDNVGSDHAAIDFGGAYLTIWPVEEVKKNA